MSEQPEFATRRLWVKASEEVVGEMLAGWSEPMRVRCTQIANGEVDLLFERSYSAEAERDAALARVAKLEAALRKAVRYVEGYADEYAYDPSRKDFQAATRLKERLDALLAETADPPTQATTEDA